MDQLVKEQPRKGLMKAFTIDSDNNITVFASSKEIGAGKETFTSLKELAARAFQWPGGRLVEIWNSLPGVVPVQKFTSRAVAAKRIWRAIQNLEPAAGTETRTVASRRGSGRKEARSVEPHSVPPNNKTTQVIALLKDPKGATLHAIMRATGWQAHSVRGFISGQLKKKLGLKVRSFKRDGERVYALRG